MQNDTGDTGEDIILFSFKPYPNSEWVSVDVGDEISFNIFQELTENNY